jgi:prepilin-type N-terminal cleavage/methylation domain-containing protein/prepilin-type processing-associated H-X9-DG protein
MMVAPRNRVSSREAGKPERGAFTLIELLVAMAIIAILAGLLSTAALKAKGKAQGIGCLGNARQLSLAWVLYATDNGERLPYNLGSIASRGVAPKRDYNWVNNILDWAVDNDDNTNTTFVTKGSFAAYASRTAAVYRCPADRVLSESQREAGWNARVRSYSMNAMVGDAGPNSQYGTNVFNPDYKQFMKSTDVERPTDIFVFLDEHPDSINDGYFLNRLDELQWNDLPASYHNGAASFTFADGHAEAHRWINKATMPPARAYSAGLPFSIDAAQRTDFDWVADRASVEHLDGRTKTRF